ncbi:hypothetical protein [Nonomuraea lactucae]|uniref:hypothetical protein n=1 Tax=Nonomuraea lactucae TaxID=2249762 RepID=UPI000DE412BB|nr:hypothetical protein [Nonomuraea lactucae]
MAAAGTVAVRSIDQFAWRPAVPPVKANLTARSILLAAAKESSMTSFSPPDPSSFVYTKFVQTNRGLSMGGTEMWLSADGSKDGVAGQTVDLTQLAAQLKEAGQPLPEPMTGSVREERFTAFPLRRCASADRPASGDCAPPGYVAQAPTDAASMRAYLFRGQNGRRTGGQVAWSRAFGLLPPRLLAPESRTALFQTLADMPGMTVEQNVTMPALPKRWGVAVVSAGAEVASMAILGTGLVADAGLRPDGTRAGAASPQKVMGDMGSSISYGMFTPWSPELISQLTAR